MSFIPNAAARVAHHGYPVRDGACSAVLACWRVLAHPSGARATPASGSKCITTPGVPRSCVPKRRDTDLAEMAPALGASGEWTPV